MKFLWKNRPGEPDDAAQRALAEGLGLLSGVEITEADDGAILIRSLDPRQLVVDNTALEEADAHFLIKRDGIRVYPSNRHAEWEAALEEGMANG